MVFNGDSTNQDICTRADDFADSDDTSFPLEQKARYATEAVQIILGWILSCYHGWQYQDSNDSNDPFSDVNAVANTSKVAIPTAAIGINGVARLDSVNNEYVPLTPITLEDIQARGYTLQNYKKTASFPDEYLLLGNYAYMFPPFSSSVTNGFRFYFPRSASTFASTDTTKTPGFAADFHMAVSCYMALQYALAKNKDNVTSLRKQWSNEADGNHPDGWEQKIKKFYKSRARELYPQRLRGSVDIVHEYE